MTRCYCCCCCCCCDVVPRTLEPGQGCHHGAGPRLGDHGAVSPRHLAAARGLGLDLLSTLYSTRRRWRPRRHFTWRHFSSGTSTATLTGTCLQSWVGTCTQRHAAVACGTCAETHGNMVIRYSSPRTSRHFSRATERHRCLATRRGRCTTTACRHVLLSRVSAHAGSYEVSSCCTKTVNCMPCLGLDSK